MTAPAFTYTITAGTTGDATQVQDNFNTLLYAMTDGTKALTVGSIRCRGASTFDAACTFGSGVSDDLTFNGSLASSIPIKTTNTSDIGSSSKGLKSVYFGANSKIVNLVGSSSMSATWTMTLPVTAGTANYALTTNGSGVTAWTAVGLLGSTNTWTSAQTFSAGIYLGSDTTNLANYSETTQAMTFTGGAFSSQAITAVIRRVGAMVTIEFPALTATVNNTAAFYSVGNVIPAAYRPSATINSLISTRVNNVIGSGVGQVQSDGSVLVYFYANETTTAAATTTNSGHNRWAVSYTV